MISLLEELLTAIKNELENNSNLLVEMVKTLREDNSNLLVEMTATLREILEPKGATIFQLWYII